MTDPQLALLMLGVLLAVIMLGFPIAFSLLALGLFFGFYAMDFRIFNLLVEKTNEVMTNDVLVALPLFLFMGYMVERSNILDRLFRSIQIAARHVPGSIAVASLITCAMFATATGIVGAVVTLMGVLAYPAMLQRALRPAAVRRGDLRRRHARHPDPALGDADPLRRRPPANRWCASTPRRSCRASFWPECTSST